MGKNMPRNNSIGLACAGACAILLFQSPAAANVRITSKATQNMSCSGGICTPTAKKAALNESELGGMLTSGDVTVNTGKGLSQDIDAGAPPRRPSAPRLHLAAVHSILFPNPP